MSYDHWKTTNPADEELGNAPQEGDRLDEPDHGVQQRAAAHAAEALRESTHLACGCFGECDPYAHDTAPDWDGTPDGPDYTRCAECDGKIYEGETHKCE
jgi:hypothetical protein